MTALDIGWRTALLFALSAPTAIAAGFIVRRATEQPAFNWLAALLLAWCWYTVPYIIGFAGAYSAFPWLTFAPFNVELWFGPLLYLHAYTLVYGRPRKAQLWWLAPGAAQFGYYSVCFVTIGDASAKFAYTEAVHGPYIVPLESSLGLGLGVAGMALTMRLSSRYQDWLQQQHAAAEAYDPAWLRRFVATTCLVIAAWAGSELWGMVVGELGYLDSYWLYVAVGILFMVMAFDALTRVDLLFPKISPPAAMPRERPKPKIDVDRLAERIRRDGLHRDPELTLARLARHIGTNENYLSRAINGSAGVNFNRFINTLRVEEVCAHLRDPEEQRSILRIAMESGFASKATFNRVFREITGETPGRRRKAALQGLKSRNSEE